MIDKPLFPNQHAEIILNSIWLKTRNFIIQNLENKGDAEALANEKEYQMFAVAKMWSKVCKDYSTHTPEECKEFPFNAVFTKRQAELILKYD